MRTKSSPRSQSSGFALPAVILISAGLMILLVALMAIVELERASSKARVGSYQAELAAESALEEAKMILAGVTSSDTYAVSVIPFAEEYDDNGDGQISSEEDDVLDTDAGERGRAYLYGIQGDTSGGDPVFNFTPLFATQEGVGAQSVTVDGQLTLPEDPGLLKSSDNNLEATVAINGTPYLSPPVTAWRMIRDQEGVPIARYSYWVEDMQGHIDAEYIPGNDRSGGHARANEVWQNDEIWNEELQPALSQYETDGGQIPLWPAPGINPGYLEEAEGFLNPENRLLSEIAVYTLDQNKTGVSDESVLDDTMRTLTPKAPTPASLLALKGAQAPIERVPVGADRGRIELSGDDDSIEDRWVEEYFTTDNRAWEEQALVPYAPGLDSSVMGAPRLNLNKLLETAGSDESPGFGLVPGIPSRAEEAVSEIADFIDTALPDFAEQRRGGFGEWLSGSSKDSAYLETIAASILDYADTDSTPIADGDRYRGIDSHPYVSEYLITHTIKGFDRSDGQRNFLIIEVEAYAELWNMSNHAAEGTFELGYDNPFVFEALGNPEVDFISPLDTTAPAGSASWASHNLEKVEGVWYSSPQSIKIPSNGYTMVSTGPITYRLFVGSADQFLPLPIQLDFPFEDVANYRLRWNGQDCDRSAAGIELTSALLTKTNTPVTKAVIPGTWGEYTKEFFTGMYDPRQSWWAGLANEDGLVSENSYPQNYSPGRRNVRWGSIGKFDPDALHGRMLVSEWPDGGHDSSFDLSTFHKRGSGSSERALLPLSNDLYPNQEDVATEPSKAPVFLSNLGRYFSETELGNIYDPQMWQHRGNPPSRTNEIWYKESANRSTNANVPEVQEDPKKSSVVGGGNTLRIGRPEHEAFEAVGLRASHLLDLFHCGQPFSATPTKRVGTLRKVEGHINVNTASREVLRTLAAGVLATDPEIALESSSFDTSKFSPRTSRRFGQISATDAFASSTGFADEAGVIADMIIEGRPYVSLSQLAALRYPEDYEVRDLRDKFVFGNKYNHDPGYRLQVSDRASEEVFARVYNSSTTRSRNFRIHVIGQALEQTPSGSLRVKATRKKSYRVFADPGIRNSTTGAIVPANLKIETLYETNL
ncbi:hypothetical protein [Roseibacillus persicicus]|uniref:hypothetical protein n=1 Tax=Roseibacillus persicicus TaxID=454148 RepID=UPI00280F8241|nr:hypothetical protein [Roseibacillus persicicus]MDQ8192040.1 hypothetical protein [Roseibacillus persicicus]